MARFEKKNGRLYALSQEDLQENQKKEKVKEKIKEKASTKKEFDNLTRAEKDDLFYDLLQEVFKR